MTDKQILVIGSMSGLSIKPREQLTTTHSIKGDKLDGWYRKFDKVNKKAKFKGANQ